MQTTESPINLTELAKQAMLERHFIPDFPFSVQQEVEHIQSSLSFNSSFIKDMRNKLWFSLDNDNSRDLDQLTYAERQNNQSFKIYVAIADVDRLVKKGSAIDCYAQHNTTSVYTPTIIFPMLPAKLSTDLTSLNENEDRLAIVIEVEVREEGILNHYAIYPAYVRNYAKLAYNSIAAWLEEKGPKPEKIDQHLGLDLQIRLQDEIAQLLRQYRHSQGALTLQTIESNSIIQNNQMIDIRPMLKNRGRELIEDFMIAANTSTAKFLQTHHLPSLRRIVRIPKRWDRIMDIAQKYGERLPPEPDAKALDLFLTKRLQVDPLHFPDLSLTIIKLLGNGEYVVEYPGNPSIGHFSLAVKDYTHSTAPNRRFPDLITQRLLKSIIENQTSPYTPNELENLARHCTQKEDDAEKVERKMKKSAAIVLLCSKINQQFDALVTGASSKGTWVRIFQPPVEGKLIKGFENIDVGDQLQVKLVSVDITKGFIDFVRV